MEFQDLIFDFEIVSRYPLLRFSAEVSKVAGLNENRMDFDDIDEMEFGRRISPTKLKSRRNFSEKLVHHLFICLFIIYWLNSFLEFKNNSGEVDILSKIWVPLSNFQISILTFWPGSLLGIWTEFQFGRLSRPHHRPLMQSSLFHCVALA